MKVELIAITQYLQDDEPTSEKSGCEALIEHAGRICYRSQMGGSKAGARFIQRRVQEGHESILEHASASFEISGISRACSHQLVRHRIASFSQESQRYVDLSEPEWVVPPEIAADAAALAQWDEHLERIQDAYRQLRASGITKQDARFLLPNAAATRMVMTANFRELLHVFRIRISPHAQWEIREVSVRMLQAVHPYAPNVFGQLLNELKGAHPTFFAGRHANE